MNIADEQEIEKMNKYLALTHNDAIYVIESDGHEFFRLYNKKAPMHLITGTIISILEGKYNLQLQGVFVESHTNELTALFKRLEQ